MGRQHGAQYSLALDRHSLSRYQCPVPVGRGYDKGLFLSALADLQTSPRAPRLRPQGVKKESMVVYANKIEVHNGKGDPRGERGEEGKRQVAFLKRYTLADAFQSGQGLGRSASL